MTDEFEQDMKQRVLEINYETALTMQFVALGGEVKKDGNMFGAIIGEMPENYCGGFAKTRNGAIQECMHNWNNEEAQ